MKARWIVQLMTAWVAAGYLAVFVSAAEETVMDSSESRFDIPPPHGKPWDPAWGYWPGRPEGWLKMHNDLLHFGDPSARVIFLGDSITRNWLGEGVDSWRKQFASFSVTLGIGGDSTRQTLWRLDHGLLNGRSPQLVVLMIGTNNLYGDFNQGSDEEIVRGVEAILESLRTRLPKVELLLLGILPRQKEYQNRIRKINALYADLARRSCIFLLDTFPVFSDMAGDVNARLYESDLVHLNAQGYAVLAGAIHPEIDRLLKNLKK